MNVAPSYVDLVSPDAVLESLKAGLHHWNETGSIPIEMFAEDCTWVPLREDPDFRLYEGHDEIRAYSETWHTLFDDLKIEVKDARAQGCDRVLVELRLSGTGAQSSATVVQDEWFLYEFEGELICRVTEFSKRDEAMQAAGLKEGS